MLIQIKGTTAILFPRNLIKTKPETPCSRRADILASSSVFGIAVKTLTHLELARLLGKVV
jgi:hypothetical protein